MVLIWVALIIKTLNYDTYYYTRLTKMFFLLIQSLIYIFLINYSNEKTAYKIF